MWESNRKAHVIIYFYTALQKSLLGTRILEIYNELEFSLNRRQCVVVVVVSPLPDHQQLLHAVQCAGFLDMEVHLEASHIKPMRSTPVISFMFWPPPLLHSSVGQAWDLRLAFLVALPANLYANEEIIINEVHAWFPPINTTLHQKMIQIATFHTARHLGGVLMWWGRL